MRPWMCSVLRNIIQALICAVKELQPWRNASGTRNQKTLPRANFPVALIQVAESPPPATVMTLVCKCSFAKTISSCKTWQSKCTTKLYKVDCDLPKKLFKPFPCTRSLLSHWTWGTACRPSGPVDSLSTELFLQLGHATWFCETEHHDCSKSIMRDGNVTIWFGIGSRFEQFSYKIWACEVCW